MENSVFTKWCPGCQQYNSKRSDFNSFWKSWDKMQYNCKKCLAAKATVIRRSQDGFIKAVYARQKLISKKRKHPMPEYTREQLFQWLYNNGFYAMWCQWNWSGHDKWFSPSVDRLEDRKGYSIGNIRLVTWRENSQKEHDRFRNGTSVNGTTAKPVTQYTLQGDVVEHFRSRSDAEAATGVPRSSISACAKGKLRQSGGYVWVNYDPKN